MYIYIYIYIYIYMIGGGRRATSAYLEICEHSDDVGEDDGLL
jgi:hypothetical protein